MTDVTAYEQLLLELVNRARLDPAGEAARAGISLNAGLAAGTLSSAARQVLAPNELLNDAASAHSLWMLAQDTFSHTGVGGSNPGNRMTAAGYTFSGSWSWGENIAWTGTTGGVNMRAYTEQLHFNLFRSAGHRENLLNDTFREVGHGVEQGVFTSGGTNYNAAMATQNFARSGLGVFITGVAISDGDHDNFYDVGEGRSGITITVSGAGFSGAGSTGAAGGYAVRATGGVCTVTFSGGGLESSVSATIDTLSRNAKVDLVGDTTILSSATATLGAGAEDLVLLGVGGINGTGNGADNDITGNAGANVLSGGSGDDVLIGGGHRDYLIGGAGRDTFDFNKVTDASPTTSLRDWIEDFKVSEDKIDLRDIDASTKSSGDQAFAWKGTAAFTGKAGQLHYKQVDYSGTKNDITIVSGDVNGDGKDDFQIVLMGLKSLNAGDFFL